MDTDNKNFYLFLIILVIFYFGSMMVNDWYNHDIAQKAIQNGYIQNDSGQWVKPVEKNSP